MEGGKKWNVRRKPADDQEGLELERREGGWELRKWPQHTSMGEPSGERRRGTKIQAAKAADRTFSQVPWSPPLILLHAHFQRANADAQSTNTGLEK